MFRARLVAPEALGSERAGAMKKTFLCAVFALFFVGIVLVASSAWAEKRSASYTTPTVLKLTLKKFEVCADPDCSSPVVLGSGVSTFDIAGISVDGFLGNYMADSVSIPKGVRYGYARLTMGRTITIQGAASVSWVGPDDVDAAKRVAAACYTKTGNDTDGTAAIEAASTDASANLERAIKRSSPQVLEVSEGSLPKGSFVVSRMFSDDEVVSVQELSSPFVLIPGGIAPEIAIDIDPTNAMFFVRDGETCLAREATPKISITVN